MSNAEETNADASVFDVSALVNLIVPFEFPFEGSTLKGTWLKYGTTTPDYAKRIRKAQQERLEKYAAIETKLKATKDRRAQLKLIKDKEKLDQEYQRVEYSWLADAIQTWNAVDKGEPIPIEAIRLDGFPLPFMVALADHLENSRTDKNPT